MCQYLLRCPFNISPTSPNPTIFTRIEPLVFKFSIFVFYTSILQGTTHSLPPILFVLQICEYCKSRSFMSNLPQVQRIIKDHFQFFTRHTLSLSLSLTFFFFFLDFSLKFVWDKNFEGVPDFT